MLFLYKKVSKEWYYCETITLGTNRIIIFYTSECSKLLERFLLWSTIRWTLTHHCELTETLSGFQKLNWKQMSSHTKKIILLLNVSSNDDKSEISAKRKVVHSRRWTSEIISRSEGSRCSHLIKNSYIMDIFNDLMEVWQVHSLLKTQHKSYVFSC